MIDIKIQSTQSVTSFDFTHQSDNRYGYVSRRLEMTPEKTELPEEPVEKKAQFKQTPLEKLKNKKKDKPELSKYFKNRI